MDGHVLNWTVRLKVNGMRKCMLKSKLDGSKGKKIDGKSDETERSKKLKVDG